MEFSTPLIISDKDLHTLLSLVRNVRTEAAELLEEELSRASIVPPTQLPPDVVAMNTAVRFEDVETGKESTVTLVYPPEASIDEGKISVLTPVGAALIGLSVGQSIHWPFPNGKEKSLKVISVTPGASAPAFARRRRAPGH